ncbi:MAG TPA: hypothetical protein VJH22_03535, partial [Candidatus Nanoarchaeia archaeon]|nr:hypothetical protein [Candidatus Nanoarchaeia archaeon]
RYDEFLWAGTALHDAYGRAIVRIQQFMNQPDAGFVGFNELSDGCDVMFLERIAGVIIPDLSRHLVVGQRMGEFEVYLREHDSSSVSEYSSPCGGSFDVHRIFARSGPNATENWETMCAGAPCIGISPDGHIYLWNPHGFGRLRGGSIGTISDIDAALR